MKSQCIFCLIANNQENAYKIFENQKFLVILDRKPLFLGHSLVLPKKHIPTLHELPSTQIKSLFTLAQKVAKAIELSMNADGSFIAINNRVSQSVPHLHIHIVPRKFKDGLKGFFWPRQKYASEEEMLATQIKITKLL